MNAIIPYFPPTSNHAYFTRGRIRALTTVGKRFKNEVKSHLGKFYPEFLAYFKKDVEYEILFIMYFANGALYNKTWPNKPGVPRHKIVDAQNRIKLAEDAVVEAAGYNDAQNFKVAIAKKEAEPEADPYFSVWVWEDNGPISRFLSNRTDRDTLTPK